MNCTTSILAVVVLCLLLIIGTLLADTSSPANPTSIAVTGTTNLTLSLPPSASADGLREHLQHLTDRVLQLQLDLTKSQQSGGSEYGGAIIAGFAGLIAALIGGWMTVLAQRMTAERERERETNAARQQLELAQEAAAQQLELARKQAVFQQTEKILEFRLKQLEQFYAPMFALLEQSKAIYAKMLHQLQQDDPKRYKILDKPDPEEYRFHVLSEDGTGKGFRMLDQLPAIKVHPKSFALAERIIKIGADMTKIISERAGLASEDITGSSQISVGDIIKLESLTTRLKQAENADCISQFLVAKLQPETKALLAKYSSGHNIQLRRALVADFNRVLQDGPIYSKERFVGVTLSPEAQKMLEQNPQGADLVRLNRLLLENSYPGALVKKPIADLLGEYLAHFEILSAIHKEESTDPYEPGWHKIGYYPRELNVRIEEGYRELSRFLDDYAKACKDLLVTLPQAGLARLAESRQCPDTIEAGGGKN